MILGRRALPPATSFAVVPRPLSALPVVGSLAALLTAPQDAVFRPDPGQHGGTGVPASDWPGTIPGPYIMMLRDAVIYPASSLAESPGHAQIAGPGETLIRKSHLVVTCDGAVVADGLAKSHFIPPAMEPASDDPDGAWTVQRTTDGPPATLHGTHLFAELIFGHFGHAVVDTPSRLWPIVTAGLRAADLDGTVGLGMLGAGRKADQLPGFVRDLLEACGVPPDRLRLILRPTRIERLIVPQRIAPYLARMHPAYNATMQAAGRSLARTARPGDRPTHLWLSRSRLNGDQRDSPSLARLDDVFADLGFTVVHPQELPLGDQIALVRGATHLAGPTGSQLHLCAFSERRGLRLFTIAPEYFRLTVNAKVLQALGGHQTTHRVPAPRPSGRVNETPWTVTDADVTAITASARAWLADQTLA